MTYCYVNILSNQNKKLKERSVVVYSEEEIRQIFTSEYLKQQNITTPNISNKV